MAGNCCLAALLSLGCSQGVRQRTLTPSFRWFESSYPNHVGAVVAAPIFSLKKSVACSSAPPLPQKCRHFWGPRPFGALQSSLLRPSPNSVFAVRRNFGPAFGQKELGEKRLLCGRFASFSPKILAILGVVSLEHKNGLHSIQKVRFWQCAAFSVKSNNIFALLFPASTLFSPLFFKLIF